MGDSNFLCLEYDNKADQVANETDSWERDHSCNTRNITTDRKCLGKADTCDVDGIQGRHITEYSQ